MQISGSAVQNSTPLMFRVSVTVAKARQSAATRHVELPKSASRVIAAMSARNGVETRRGFGTTTSMF